MRFDVHRTHEYVGSKLLDNCNIKKPTTVQVGNSIKEFLFWIVSFDEADEEKSAFLHGLPAMSRG